MLGLTLDLQAGVPAAGSLSESGVFQWAVDVDGVKSRETGKSPRAYLWIPQSCTNLEAVVFANDNMLEEPLLAEPDFRRELAAANCGIVFVTPGFQDRNQGLTEATDCPMIEAVLANLALVSGYDELAKKTRLAPLGHSAWSDWPYFIAHAFPERTACGISLKGSWPHMKQGRFFNDGFAAGIKGIPL